MPKPKIDLKKLEGKFEKPSRYIKFKVGDNRIRVLSEPYQYYVLGIRTARGYLQHVIEEGVEVPDLFANAKPKVMFGFVVYSHDSGHFHVLETGPMLGVPLVQMVQEKYPEEYKAFDIIVKARGESLNREYEAEWAKESYKLPEGVSRKHPEYQFMLGYFEGFQKDAKAVR